MSLINILTRFSVPCFVMISGAFILSNTGNGNAKMFYKKTSYRIFLPAIVSTIVMIIPVVVYDAIIGDSVIHDLLAIPKGTAFNMWYIWMLVGLYALTPIVILIKRNLSFKQYASCSFIMLIWAVVSQAFSQQQLPYSIGVVIAYVSYFTIGDVIKTRIGVIGVSHQKRNVVTCIVFGFCAVLAAYYCRKAGYNYYISDAYTNFFSPAIVIYSIAVFSFFCFINVKRNCSALSGKTYYVYIYHTIVLIVVLKIVGRIAVSNIFLQVIITTVLTLGGAYVCGEIFRWFWSKCEKRGLKEKWYGLRYWTAVDE